MMNTKAQILIKNWVRFDTHSSTIQLACPCIGILYEKKKEIYTEHVTRYTRNPYSLTVVGKLKFSSIHSKWNTCKRVLIIILIEEKLLKGCSCISYTKRDIHMYCRILVLRTRKF